jgi:neutral ceramidase
MSEAQIEWHLDEDVEKGTYRIGYFGNHKAVFRR